MAYVQKVFFLTPCNEGELNKLLNSGWNVVSIKDFFQINTKRSSTYISIVLLQKTL